MRPFGTNSSIASLVLSALAIGAAAITACSHAGVIPVPEREPSAVSTSAPAGSARAPASQHCAKGSHCAMARLAARTSPPMIGHFRTRTGKLLGKVVVQYVLAAAMNSRREARTRPLTATPTPFPSPFADIVMNAGPPTASILSIQSGLSASCNMVQWNVSYPSEPGLTVTISTPNPTPVNNDNSATDCSPYSPPCSTNTYTITTTSSTPTSSDYPITFSAQCTNPSSTPTPKSTTNSLAVITQNVVDNVTGTSVLIPQNRVAGQHIDLIEQDAPSVPAQDQAVDWFLPSEVVTQYVQAIPTPNISTPSQTDLWGLEIKYYYPIGPPSETTQFQAAYSLGLPAVGGGVVELVDTDTIPYTILEPTVNALSAAPGPIGVQVGLYNATHPNTLSFGINPAPSPSPGITWTYTATAPQGDTGYISMTQLINSQISVYPNFPQSCWTPNPTTVTLNQFWLDNNTQYNTVISQITAAGGQATWYYSGTLKPYDAPDIGPLNLLPPNCTELERDDKFQDYFMYKSSKPEPSSTGTPTPVSDQTDSIWVTEGTLTWSWGGCAKPTPVPSSTPNWFLWSKSSNWMISPPPVGPVGLPEWPNTYVNPTAAP